MADASAGISQDGSVSDMATLHFICGKAGAGKTTFARELGRRLPAVVICEDEWVARLGFEIRTLGDYVAASQKCRAVIGPLTGDLLRLGVSVVFDFAGNTVKSRSWVRSIFETSAADHILHVIEATDEQCIENIQRRNIEQPPGIYWGDVSEEIFHEVTQYFVPPGADEAFCIRMHAGSRL